MLRRAFAGTSNEPTRRDLELRVAIASEAAYRTHGLEAREVQLAAALALSHGAAVELATGEGKSLVGVLAAAALTGGGVHVVAPNEYLADRDASFARAALAMLGLNVAAARETDEDGRRRQAYRADVTYGAARTFAFDRLRDGQARHAFERFEPRARAALIDEIDSVLFDFAEQPFVLGTPSGLVDPWPARANAVVERLGAGVDFEVDARSRCAWLTDAGEERALRLLEAGGHLQRRDASEATETYLAAMRALRCALEAHTLFHRDREYVVLEDTTLVPIERATGRLGRGRRFAQGLHAALEVKERLPVGTPGDIVAELDVRSLFATYDTLGGMSGTLGALDEELLEAWEMPVVRLPPHVPSIRRDDARYFRTEAQALVALLDEVDAVRATGRPMLVGVESEVLARHVSAELSARGIPHGTLTARDHAREAVLVEAAGRRSAITVATRVAGRGTDIRLGGTDATDADAVRALGGLRILALGHARDARVDEQLRGRAGRGGDPGHVTFFGSLEDPPVVEAARESEVARWLESGSTGSANDQLEVAELVLRCQGRCSDRRRASRREARRYLGVLVEHRIVVEALQRALVEGTAHPSERGQASPDFDARRFADELDADLRELLTGRGPAGQLSGAGLHVAGGRVAPRAAVLDLYRRYGVRLRVADLPESLEAALPIVTARVTASLEVQVERFADACAELAVGAAGSGEGGPETAAYAIARAWFESRPLGAGPGRALTEDDRRRLRSGTARAAADALISAGPERTLRAFRVAYLSHLADAFQAHVEETRWLARDAWRAPGTRDPEGAFRVATHRRFEAQLRWAKTTAAAHVLRAVAREERTAAGGEAGHREKAARGS